jgi:hypothetical protein
MEDRAEDGRTTKISRKYAVRNGGGWKWLG